jgi:hypothetical protein
MDELEQLRLENARLRKELEAKQHVAPSLINNSQTKQPLLDLTQSELLADMARYSEGLYTEKFIRRKYRDLLSDTDWERLASDEDLIEKIELEKVRRERSGQAKRERAQQLITKAPNVLDTIMSNPTANERHRIDAAKALDSLADPGPQNTLPMDKFVIRIDLTADAKLRSAEPDPADIITIETARPATIADKKDDWQR